MSDYTVNFSVSPWILLLLIPALAVPLFLHFRQKKEHRRTRNRIIALVLHCLALTLAVFALSGIFFSLELPDESNELVILVDSSFSTEKGRDRTDKFVYELLAANDGRCKTSIVTFGYDQKIALEPGIYNADKAFETYKKAAPPNDTTATDICAALEFCWDPVMEKSGGEGNIPVINYPDSARIVLISDGIETDQKAQAVARRLAMEGVRIDTTFFGGDTITDMWIANVEYEDASVEVGDPVSFNLDVRSTFGGEATITLEDMKNGIVVDTDTIERSIKMGPTSVNFNHKFTSGGHHELKFSLVCDADPLKKNNVYYTYFDIDEDMRALVIGRYKEDTVGVEEVFSEQIAAGQISFQIMDLDHDRDKIPQTIVAMQEYDEIILANIANKDFDENFWKNLQTYVQKYGGGLFTYGGVERTNGKPSYFKDDYSRVHAKTHSYDEADMKDSIFQNMLPVQVTDYTPPIGLMIIIDCSGSMQDKNFNGNTLVDFAIHGALACVDMLSTRDYVGVTILSDTYEDAIEMTPMSKKAKIKNAIRDIANSTDGGTNYTNSLEYACRALAGLPAEVQRKHILFLSDGAPGDSGKDYYQTVFSKWESQHITMTMTCIDGSNRVFENVQKLAKDLGGEVRHYKNNDLSTLPDDLAEDLHLDDKLYGAIEQNYNIKVASRTNTLNGITNNDIEAIRLGGFFTTAVKGYNQVENPLMAEYVPLYAQWRYGEGRVGSYMCDLGSLWGGALIESDAGKKFIQNVVLGLMPTVNLSTNTLSARFIEDNYRTQVSVYNFDPEVEKDKKLVAYVQQPAGSAQALIRFDLSELSVGGNRFTFENKFGGVYTVTIVKVAKSFNPFLNDVRAAESASAEILRAYRSFSYSEEYTTEADSYTNGKNLMIALSTRDDAEGEDKFIYEADSIIESFEFAIKDVDPRPYLYIAAIVLLLLGVIVRKFKFKWPHEIIRAHKARHEDQI